MVMYLIGYEGRGERPYDRLQEAIDQRGGVHLIDNLWALECDSDAASLRDWVHDMMDDDDAIIVMQLKNGNHWASRHLKTSVNDWLKTHI
ncbi:hypothetical protein [Pararhizobium haloflavum]|uniref:hypothetical protein n=1 Tax=Pararhizobium haloflavum TaxID=2037914 RepID=UPI000C186F70|nr:hypothetical protein [Pararhizobium haloflavum]